MRDAFEPNRKQIPALNGLRGLAVLLVLWAHLPTAGFDALTLLRKVIQPGYAGVDIFFVLSGFLITRILLADRADGRSLINFLIRRSLRIFPIYYLTLVVCWFAAPGIYLLWCALYVQNFTFAADHAPNPLRHTWSLAVEEHFYLLWPIVIYAISWRWSMRVAWILVAVGLLIAFAAVGSGRNEIIIHIYRGTPVRVASLAAGALLSFFEIYIHRQPRRALFVSGLIATIGGAILVGAAASRTAWTPAFKVAGFGLVSTAIVLAAVAADDLKAFGVRALQRGALPYLGKISYGIYLYHYPIYGWMGVLHGPEQLEAPGITRVIFAVALTLATAALSFALLEQRILRLKSHFR